MPLSIEVLVPPGAALSLDLFFYSRVRELQQIAAWLQQLSAEQYWQAKLLHYDFVGFHYFCLSLCRTCVLFSQQRIKKLRAMESKLPYNIACWDFSKPSSFYRDGGRSSKPPQNNLFYGEKF
jgi:hypothetical protein